MPLQYKTHGPTRFSVEDQLEEALESMSLLNPRQRKNFMRLFRKFWNHKKKEELDWKEVKPPHPEMLVPLAALETCPNDMNLQHELLDKLVILKLNGGLGTTLGCYGPKSAIEVRQDYTFLDLTVRQVEYLNSMYGADVPLVLMNSFNTHEETVRIIKKYQSHNLSIHTFNQSCYPFLVKETMLPLSTSKYDSQSREQWYPPGHGDVYTALFESGLLQNLVNQGKEYVFISNVDNLGATVNLDILYHMINADSEFMMEVTDKTRADVQGDALVVYNDKPRLVEITTNTKPSSQDQRNSIRGASENRSIPPNFIPSQTFNTNNLWVNLRAIQRLVAQDLICMRPVVSTSILHDTKVMQMETAAGDACMFFKGFVGIQVPRARFLPVKSSSDLFLVQSNLYKIKHGCLLMHPDRENSQLNVPIVKLGYEFRSVDAYSRRFEKGIPDIMELEHLTIAGDVKFGANVTLKGTVILVANEGAHIDLPDGTVLENKVVTGNLRILDH